MSHGWRARRPAGNRRLAEAEETPALTAADERALEVIRRQIDLDFGYSPPAAEAAPAAGARAIGNGAAAAEDGRDSSARSVSSRARPVMVVCARLLIWGALGALVTLMYVKNSDVPAPIRRQLLPARPGAAGPAAVALGEPVTIWPSDVARADAAKREAVARPDPPGRPASAGASPARPAASRVPGHRAYWVQVGAFRNRDEARRLASRLRDAPVVVVEAGPAGSRLAKVRIGPFPDRPAALAKLRQLQGQGFGAFLAEALD